MRKNTLIAVVIFALLVVIGVITSTDKKERGIKRIKFTSVDTSKIDKVELSGKHTATLTKEAEKWLVKRTKGAKQADQNAVKRLVESIEKIESSDLVTSDEKRYADYEVDDEKGTTFKAYAGKKKVAEFVVGKSASGGVHLRLNKEVYIVSKVYPGTFNKDTNGWLEKKLFDVKLDQLAKVEVGLSGKAPYTIIKKDKEWELLDASVLPNNFRFDKSSTNRVASSLAGLRAKDILEEDPGVEKTKLDKDYDVLVFYAKPESEKDKEGEKAKGKEEKSLPAGEKKYEIHLGATDTEGKFVYAQVVGNDDIITIYESTVNNLRKVPTDFRDMKLVDLDTSKVKSVTIVDDKKKLVLAKKGSDWSIASYSDKIPNAFQLDPSTITQRLSAFANARAQKAAQGVSAGKAGLLRPKAKITAKLEDGKSVTLAFGKEIKVDDKDMVYGQGNIDKLTYLFTPYVKKNITGMLDTFKKREQPGGFGNLDPSALKNLPPDVRRSLMQQMRQKQREQKMLEKIQAQMAKKKSAAPKK